jgi:hypothetical protein
MSITVLIPASTYRLTTMAAVMAEVPLQDQLLFAESLIDQASAAVARYCGTILAQQAYREVQTGCYVGPIAFVRYWPLVSLTSVSYGAPTEVLTPITDYRIESAEGGLLYRRQGWRLWWSSAEEWQIDYTAGYILPEQIAPVDPLGPTLPDDLERATLETIKVWFHERMVGERVESRRLGEQSISYGVQARRTGIPVLAKDLLQPWKRLRVA